MIQAECDRIGPIEVGQAAITGAGKLPCRHVIHQASMRLGGRTTAESLSNSTAAVLKIAEENEIKTLAFPAVGTGVAGFDIHRCAEIMIGQVVRHVEGSTHLTNVYFVLFDENAYRAFCQVLQHIWPDLAVDNEEDE